MYEVKKKKTREEFVIGYMFIVHREMTMMMMMKRVGEWASSSQSQDALDVIFKGNSNRRGLWHLIRHWSLHALFQSRSQFYLCQHEMFLVHSMSALFHITQANDLWDAIVSRWIPPVFFSVFSHFVLVRVNVSKLSPNINSQIIKVY